MNTKRRGRIQRVARTTLLIMGEGYAEVEFLSILRREYTANRQGVQLTIANAYGKGARNVIQQAINRRNGFDRTGALFDTDTDWNDTVKKMGEKHGLILLPCEPCLEGSLLLPIMGVKPLATTAQNKALFEKLAGAQAHANGVLTKAITRARLDVAEEQQLEPLLSLLKIIRGE